MGSLEQLRELNRLRVVDELRRRGNASRGEIADATGLSRTTVTTLVADLQERGLVIELSPNGERTARGRPPVQLRLDPSAGAAIGVDFGHSHVHVAVSDLSAGVLGERAEVLGALTLVIADTERLRSVGLASLQS